MGEYERILKKQLKAQDKQIKAIHEAEAKYKDDLPKLIEFWEAELAERGLLINGTKWRFRLIDLYYRSGRYDDAWHKLNMLLIDPSYRERVRKWQIRILKKEKKDYTHIQQLLDNNQ